MIKQMIPRFLIGLLALGPATVTAQGGSWPTVHQQALWLTTTVEHRISPKTAITFDGTWRRMGFGEEPQQLLVRPGISRTIAPGVLIAAGYAYIATAPYGEVPIAAPLREHRAWQQISFNHSAGPAAITHRYRWEERWIAPLAGTRLGEFRYQQRARYMVRGQLPLWNLTYRSRPVTGYVQEELLMPVGHSGAAGRLTQNRFMFGAGLPLTERQRLDVGYMNLWNAIASEPANEVNHTVTFNWVIRSGK